MNRLFKTLSRRWLLGFLCVAALLFGLAMLHPYPRQSLFGPTIRGEPRCVWEAAVRDRPISMLEKALRWIGVKRDRLSHEELFDDTEMVPIVMDMLDDHEGGIRYDALTAIPMYASLQDNSLLPALQRRLASNAKLERAMAARGIWRISKEKQMIPIFLELLDEKDGLVQGEGIQMVVEELKIAGDAEVYQQIAVRASDGNPSVRATVMKVVKPLGKKYVPILLVGLKDSNVDVRQTAAWALKHIGPDAADAIPLLERQLTDDNAKLRELAARALRAIEPVRSRI